MSTWEQVPHSAESNYLAPVYAEVDATIRRLAAKQFLIDPVVEARYSRITSIVSSAYKRHGGIIERALAAALRQSSHLQVWDDPIFRISAAAERLADSDAEFRRITHELLGSGAPGVHFYGKGWLFVAATAVMDTTSLVSSLECV